MHLLEFLSLCFVGCVLPALQCLAHPLCSLARRLTNMPLSKSICQRRDSLCWDSAASPEWAASERKRLCQDLPTSIVSLLLGCSSNQREISAHRHPHSLLLHAGWTQSILPCTRSGLPFAAPCGHSSSPSTPTVSPSVRPWPFAVELLTLPTE